MVKHFASIHIKQQGNMQFKQQAEQREEKWLGLQQQTCIYLNQEVNTHALEHIMLWMLFEELTYLEMIVRTCVWLRQREVSGIFSSSIFLTVMFNWWVFKCQRKIVPIHKLLFFLSWLLHKSIIGASHM